MAGDQLMRDIPILFQGAMVRANLNGTKTMTRRIAKGMPGPGGYRVGGTLIGPGGRPIKSPYGLPGDRLWVREAWRVGAKFDNIKPSDIPDRSCSVLYAAGGSASNTSDGWRFDDAWPGDCPVPWAGKLRPSMFMPRWASRIALEIVDVRVERLQDISEADARAEGCEPIDRGIWWKNYTYPVGFDGKPTKVVGYRTAIESYRSLWEAINGDGSWAANPWVWVVEFRRVC